MALLLLSWVFLNAEVSFHLSKAISCLDSGAGGHNRGGVSVWECPNLLDKSV